MCGIGGMIAASAIPNVQARLKSIQASLQHRGPDDSGVFVDEQGAALAHVRLSIFDPEHGQQPLTAGQGRYTIVFNGAIYNYLELRRELVQKGCKIQSFCDTEVLLHAFIQWGPQCLARLNGMFAFCIWDSHSKTAFVARDRVGIKPLYYHLSPQGLTFGSEIKAILASGMYQPKASQEAISDYLTLQFVLGEHTLFDGINKLEPGHWMTTKFVGGRVETHIERYWDIPTEPDESLSEDYCIDRLSELIDDSVRLRLRSDVAVGAHLSGGLDSSTIVGVAKSLLGEADFNSFTGYFAEAPEFSEIEYARIVAKESSVLENEVLVSGEGFESFLPKILYHMDEPAAGPGVIPQYFVSQAAGRKVKVVLGGQGGDELFVGYARYLLAYLEESLRGAIFESSDRKIHVATLSSLIESLPVLSTYVPLMQKFWATGLFEDSASRYLRLIDRSDDVANYISGDMLSYRANTESRFLDVFNKPGLKSLVNKMTNFELQTSLTSLLQVEDRTSMAASLESRVPLLDHRIVEFMFQVSPMIKFKGGRLKHLFSESVRNKVPAEILNRKTKMGFPVPLQHWFQGSAKEFVEDTLLGPQAQQRGLYDTAQVSKLIRNEGKFSRTVWGLLCLELWHQIFIDQSMGFDAINPGS